MLGKNKKDIIGHISEMTQFGGTVEHSLHPSLSMLLQKEKGSHLPREDTEALRRLRSQDIETSLDIRQG